MGRVVWDLIAWKDSICNQFTNILRWKWPEKQSSGHVTEELASQSLDSAWNIVGAQEIFIWLNCAGILKEWGMTSSQGQCCAPEGKVEQVTCSEPLGHSHNPADRNPHTGQHWQEVWAQEKLTQEPRI